jgi:hypothetical protein
MSLGNQGVLQLLEEVNFRRFLAFYDARKWDHFGGICSLLVDWRDWPKSS